MSYTIQNITEISKIVGCPLDFYRDQSNNTDPYYESTIYMVNNGVSINQEGESEEIAYTDLYYGSRKLTDTLIINENGSPDHPEYPNDKFYIKPTIDNNDIITGYRVFYKHDDFVIPIATTDQLILVDEAEDHPSMLKMTLKINNQEVKANVLCVNEDGTLPSDIYSTLYNQLKTEMISEVHALRWKSMAINSRSYSQDSSVEVTS